MQVWIRNYVLWPNVLQGQKKSWCKYLFVSNRHSPLESNYKKIKMKIFTALLVGVYACMNREQSVRGLVSKQVWSSWISSRLLGVKTCPSECTFDEWVLCQRSRKLQRWRERRLLFNYRRVSWRNGFRLFTSRAVSIDFDLLPWK